MYLFCITKCKIMNSAAQSERKFSRIVFPLREKLLTLLMIRKPIIITSMFIIVFTIIKMLFVTMTENGFDFVTQFPTIFLGNSEGPAFQIGRIVCINFFVISIVIFCISIIVLVVVNIIITNKIRRKIKRGDGGKLIPLPIKKFMINWLVYAGWNFFILEKSVTELKP